MNLVTIEYKLADIEIAIREFGLALKQCINDFRTASRIGVKYPVYVKYENKCAHIIENKYKSFLVTLDDSGYNDMVIIQLCRRDGKIVDGMMMPLALFHATDLKSVGSNAVPVRVRPQVLNEKPHTSWGFLLYTQFSSFAILWNMLV